MRRILPFLLVLLCGVAIGYVLGSQGEPAPLPEAPVAPAPEPEAAPMPELPPDDAVRRENEALRAEVAELRKAAARAPAAAATEPKGPVRLGAETGDPAVSALQVLVTGADGEPLPDVKVNLHRYEEGGSAKRVSATTDAGGRVAFADLAPGKVRFSALAGGGRTRSHSTVLVGGRATEADIRFPRGCVVEGEVSHAEKGPLAKVLVMMSSREGGLSATFTATTGEAGRYRLEDVPPGRYSMSVSGSSLGYRPRSPIYLDVPERGPVRKDVVVGIPSLRGTITDAVTRQPIRGASIQIQQGAPYQTVSTDSRGEYRFMDLRPGTLQLCVSRKGYAVVFPRGVKVEEGGSRFDLTLDPAARLMITVYDPDGQPFTGRLYFGISSKVEGEGTNVGTSVTTDDAGRATYDQILPGEYRLRFKAEGVGEAKVEVKVTTGETPLQVRLVRE